VKRLISLLLLSIALCPAGAQVKIHAHNDYAKPVPLFDALQNNVFSIEADIFFVKGELLVAHTLKESTKKKTLSSLYINPIIGLFKKYQGSVSADSSYKTSLVIDIKQNGTEILKELVRIFEPLRTYFDRSVNPHAVQLIISGDRGPINEWKNYPSYIYFDGRPFEEYDQKAIDKIAMISDNYYKYLSPRNNNGDSTKIRVVVKKAHEWKKPFRFWGSPDTETAWKLLKESGADIINTDKVKECRVYFSK
jgi:hypothetical protein